MKIYEMNGQGAYFKRTGEIRGNGFTFGQWEYFPGNGAGGYHCTEDANSELDALVQYCDDGSVYDFHDDDDCKAIVEFLGNYFK